MRRVVFAALLAALLLGGFTGMASGQGRPRRIDPSQTVPAPGKQPPPGQTKGATTPATPDSDSDDSDPLKLEGALIEVPVVASDRSGRYVPQLRQEDFRILEDGKQQQISFFTSERVPIHVALVMDTSGSTRGTIRDIQEAAIDFIGQLLPNDQVMIVSFGSQVIVEQEFTSDRAKLAASVRRTQPLGSTKLYEAVYLTVAERLAHIEGRKAMIILSDGEDTASKDVNFEQAVNVCSESDVIAYGIRYPESVGSGVYTRPRNRRPTPGPIPRGYPAPGAPRSNFAPTAQFGGGAQAGSRSIENDPFMETVTANSGGTLFYAGAIGDVRGLFASIADELRHVYILGYSPSNSMANGGHRRISVQIPGRPDLAIRHRLGYQADAYKQ